jgi:hypothetical protein
MKLIVITAMICATTIACVLLLRDDLAPSRRRYQLYSIEETASPSGQNVRSVYRLDTISGKTWRISANPVPTESKDSQNNPLVMWPEGWEELPESPEAAVAKAAAEYQRAVEYARASKKTQPPQPSVTPP